MSVTIEKYFLKCGKYKNYELGRNFYNFAYSDSKFKKKVKIHKYCAYVLIATHHEIEKQDK